MPRLASILYSVNCLSLTLSLSLSAHPLRVPFYRLALNQRHVSHTTERKEQGLARKSELHYSYVPPFPYPDAVAEKRIMPRQ